MSKVNRPEQKGIRGDATECNKEAIYGYNQCWQDFNWYLPDVWEIGEILKKYGVINEELRDELAERVSI